MRLTPRSSRAFAIHWANFKKGNLSTLAPRESEIEHFQKRQRRGTTGASVESPTSEIAEDVPSPSGLSLFLRDVVSRTLSKNLASNSAAITYNLILSLVPLLAIAFTFFQFFGGLDILLKSVVFPRIELTFRTDSAATINGYLRALVANIQTKTLGATALLTLLITVTTLLGAIERAFNDIRESREQRTWLSRLLNYWLLLTLTPFVIVVSTAKSSEILAWMNDFFAFSVSSNASLFARVLRRLGAFAIESGGFALLYWTLPARRVSTRAALLGGLVAGLGFESLQWINASLTSRVYRQASIVQLYGSVPLIIVVLFVWLRLIAFVLLLGMVCATSWSRVFDRRPQRNSLHRAPQEVLLTTCSVFDIIVRASTAHDIEIKMGINRREIQEQLSLAANEAKNALVWLQAQGLVIRAQALPNNLETTASGTLRSCRTSLYLPTPRGLSYHAAPQRFLWELLLTDPNAPAQAPKQGDTATAPQPSDSRLPEAPTDFKATIRQILHAHEPK